MTIRTTQMQAESRQEKSELVAFIDESRKPVRNPATGGISGSGEHYVVAAAVVLRGDIAEIRNQLQEIQMKVGYPLHYQELSPSRQARALDLIDEIADWDGYLFETDRALPSASYSEHHVRAKVIEKAFGYLDELLCQFGGGFWCGGGLLQGGPDAV